MVLISKSANMEKSMKRTDFDPLGVGDIEIWTKLVQVFSPNQWIFEHFLSHLPIGSGSTRQDRIAITDCSLKVVVWKIPDGPIGQSIA